MQFLWQRHQPTVIEDNPRWNESNIPKRQTKKAQGIFGHLSVVQTTDKDDREPHNNQKRKTE